MTRYLQKISLRPFTDEDVWTGWDLEGYEGELEGLVLAESMSKDELSRLGVTEFNYIPARYLEAGEFPPKK